MNKSERLDALKAAGERAKQAALILDDGVEKELGSEIISTLEDLGYSPEELVPALLYATRYWLNQCEEQDKATREAVGKLEG